jgi:hypothetical protein
MFYQNDLDMRSTVDMTGGKPTVVRLQSISGGDAVNPYNFNIALDNLT